MNLRIPRIIKGWGIGKNIVPAEKDFIENEMGPGRKYAKEKIAPFYNEAFSAFNLKPCYLEPMFETFTGVHYRKGAFTHIHQDSAPKDFAHVRCNVMLKKPKEGGDPIIDGEILKVEEGDLWIVFSSLELHGSTPISEPYRIIKSFGALIPINNIAMVMDHNQSLSQKYH